MCWIQTVQLKSTQWMGQSQFTRTVHVCTLIFWFICLRFKREANKPSQGNNNMKKILSHCRDIQMKYKLATSLGLTDVVMEMYKGDGSAYLKDTASA